MENETINCTEHGDAYITYVCKHLISRETNIWYSGKPDDERQWTDAWCGKCHKHYLAEGEWNDISVEAANPGIKIMCHECYEKLRSECEVHYL